MDIGGCKVNEDEQEGRGCFLLIAIVILCLTAYSIASLFAPK